jgi:uncharacterized membrane protein YecN with MAPEG domain
MTPIVVPGYAAVFVLIFVLLAVNVSRLRSKYKVSIGAGGRTELERAARVHGNFAEYVPFAILLLAFMEMQRQSIFVIHILAIVLLVGRLLHAYGVGGEKDNMSSRGLGYLMTLGVMVVAAVFLLVNALRAI